MFWIYFLGINAAALLGAYLARHWDLSWRDGQRYYPVALPKFITLNIVTLGLYDTYWADKNWHWAREVGKEDVSPIMRVLALDAGNDRHVRLNSKFSAPVIAMIIGYAPLCVLGLFSAFA